MAVSGSRRKKRIAKIAKRKLPKRNHKKDKRQIKHIHFPKPIHKHIKKHQLKFKKRQRRVIKKQSRRKSAAWYRAETKARHWIEYVESRGNWNANNGQDYGRYQLAYGYLHGDYSHANQRLTAERYVHNRYGSWQRAVAFHKVNGWY